MIDNIEYWDKLVKLGCAKIQKVDDPNLPNTFKYDSGLLYQYILTVPKEDLDHVLLTEQAYTLHKIYNFLIGLLIAAIVVAVIIVLFNCGFLTMRK